MKSLALLSFVALAWSLHVAAQGPPPGGPPLPIGPPPEEVEATLEKVDIDADELKAKIKAYLEDPENEDEIKEYFPEDTDFEALENNVKEAAEAEDVDKLAAVLKEAGFDVEAFNAKIKATLEASKRDNDKKKRPKKKGGKDKKKRPKKKGGKDKKKRPKKKGGKGKKKGRKDDDKYD